MIAQVIRDALNKVLAIFRLNLDMHLPLRFVCNPPISASIFGL